jgi:hypothetical protein
MASEKKEKKSNGRGTRRTLTKVLSVDPIELADAVQPFKDRLVPVLILVCRVGPTMTAPREAAKV